MKSKLLLCVSLTLFFTQILAAQTWNTLGSTQFSNDPKYIATDVDETTGNLYVAYVDQTDSDHLKVKFYDGSAWIDLGGTVSTIGNVLFPSIRVNPATNEVWVAYRTDISPSNKILMVKRYDGSSWTIEGQDISGSKIPTQKIILRFSPAGEAFIAYIFTAGGSPQGEVISNRTGSWAFEVGTAGPKPYGMDFPSYRLIYYNYEAGIPFSTIIDRRVMNANTFNWSNPTNIIGINVYPADNYQGLAATTGPALIAMHNFNSGDDIDISTFNTDLTPPANSDLTDGKSIQLIRNPIDGLSYLLYVKTNGEVVVSSYDGSAWTDITGLNANIGASSGDSALRAKLSMRESDGRMFVTYKDGSSITTQYFDVTPAPTKIYVDQSASGNNDGSSWADAFTDLQTGIDAAKNNFIADSVWVAQGTYKPDTSDRTKRFNIDGNGIKVFGGFNGTESDFSQRDVRGNPTIISGDLNDNDDPNDVTYSSLLRLDNSYKLFYVDANNVEINGFTLKGGHADLSSNNFNNRGAAVYKEASASNFIIKRCIITENVANREGTLNLAHTVNSDVLIESCEFTNNLGRYGAGFSANQNSGSATLNIVINNSLFYNNVSVEINGGNALNGSSFGVFLNNGGQANVTITNNTFSNNYDLGTNASFDKGTVVLRRFTSSDVLNAEVHNNVFWNNFSDNAATVNAQNIGIANGQSLTSLNFTHNNSIQTNLASKASTFTESNNLNTDPLFEDEANFDFSLQASSPMIDSGDNTQVPSGVTEDILGNNRFENTTVDRGAFEFFVPNTVPPTVVTQDITVQLDANGQVSIEASDIDNGSTDDQTSTADLILSLDQTSFDCSNIGQNTVTLTVEDEAGNTASDTAMVTVEDITAPNAITQDITVQLDANGQANIQATDIDNGSTDNCNVNSLSLDITNFDCSSIGQNTVTLTVEDDQGNSTTETAIVTVEDGVAPTPVVQDITVQLDANGVATVDPNDVDNGSTDNCGIASFNILNNLTYDCSDIGTNTDFFQVVDNSGNTASAQFNVTVEDNTAPNAITQDINVQLDANGQANIQASDIDDGSTDNCNVNSLSLDVTNFNCSSIGQNTVTLTVEDDEGNSATDTAIVNVEDNLAPTLTTQDITVDLAGNNSVSISGANVLDNVGDNCSSVSDISLSLDQDTFTSIGTYTVNLTATDLEGNQTTVSAIVIVEDTLSVNQVDYNFEVKIYPNPTSDYLNIESKQLEVLNIKIFDIKGKLLKSSKNSKIDVMNLSNGVYILKIESFENQFAIKRFIKK